MFPIHPTAKNLYLTLVLTGLSVTAPSLAQSQPLPPTPFDPAPILQIMADTEPFLRPPPAERLMLLAQELQARGLERAARELRAQLNAADLAAQLLRLGQPAAALEVINLWKKESPGQRQALVLESIALLSQGSADLAIRAIDQIPPAGATNDSSFIRLLRDLASFRLSHDKPPSIDANPWNALFVMPDFPFQPGQMPEAEKAKLPGDLPNNLARLLSYEPLQGSLWALLGEVLNGHGQIEPARTCFARAKSLGYTPRWLIDHARALSQLESQKNASLDAALSQSSSTTPNSAPPAAGWTSLWDRPKEWWVAALGLVFALVIMALQIRQWLGRTRR